MEGVARNSRSPVRSEVRAGVVKLEESKSAEGEGDGEEDEKLAGKAGYVAPGEWRRRFLRHASPCHSQNREVEFEGKRKGKRKRVLVSVRQPRQYDVVVVVATRDSCDCYKLPMRDCLDGDGGPSPREKVDDTCRLSGKGLWDPTGNGILARARDVAPSKDVDIFGERRARKKLHLKGTTTCAYASPSIKSQIPQSSIDKG
ncbi:uncharacterized protein G2W53_002895 [Senna tora]|uniref:Uncharacterized protein n=1 Tax=Senna tora TaxID=362788 RepID=A0A834X9Z7_9FABA|nr:uncharacterized protein G2W53_002895 [Senna tora]